MSILQIKSRESYLSKIGVLSESSIKVIDVAIRSFEVFVLEFYKKPIDEVFSGMDESDVYELLQLFVNHLYKKGLQPRSIKCNISRSKPYLAYRTGIKIHSEDLRENIKLPKIHKRKNYPLQLSDYKKILDFAGVKRKVLYLFLGCTGMRIGEAVRLRKRDIISKYHRVMVRLPASYTKTKQERITFVSKEVEIYLLPILETLHDDDLIFGSNSDHYRSVLNEEQSFMRMRKRAGIKERYESGISKITIHSFRSWFITKLSKVDLGVAHALAGHEHYMKQYERYSEEELLEYYIKAENHLAIYDFTPDEKIKTLESKVSDLESRLAKMAHKQRMLLIKKTN